MKTSFFIISLFLFATVLFSPGALACWISCDCDPGDYCNFICRSCNKGYKCPGDCGQDKCAKGTYQPSKGKSSCIDSGAGYYVPTTGSRTRTSCPKNYYCPGTANQAATPCPANSNTNGQIRRTTISQCVCNNGYFKNSTSGECQKCGCGYSSPQGSTSLDDCEQAGIGNYQSKNAGAAADVKTCPAGSICPTNTTCNPATCGPGTFSGAGASECTDCSPGAYASGNGWAECVNASEGNFVAGSAQQAQTPCTAGYECPARGMASPSVCPCGKFSLEGAAVCSNTTAGYYSASAATKEESCPVGHECPSDNMCGPSQCNCGYYSPGINRTSCKRARRGYFASGKANTGQTVCTAGYRCPDRGMCDPLVCVAGTWSGSGARVCTNCSNGTFSTAEGATNNETCQSCPAGTFNPDEGSPSPDNCRRCPPAFYCDEQRLSAPKPCPKGTTSRSWGSTSLADCVTLTKSLSESETATASSTASSSASSSGTHTETSNLTLSESSTVSASVTASDTQPSATGSVSDELTLSDHRIALLPVTTFGLLHAPYQEFTQATLPPSQPDPFQQLNDKTSMDAVKNVVRSLSGGTMPYSVTVSVSMTTLGDMVPWPSGIPTPSVAYTVSASGDSITFTSSSTADLAAALEGGYVFAMNPLMQTEDKDKLPGLTKVEGRDGSGAHKGVAVLSGLRELRVNPGPATPYSSPQLQFEQNVSRGSKYAFEFGFFFTHAMSLPMEYAVSDRAGLPAPQSIKISCRASDGFCTARGTWGQWDYYPMELILQASDGHLLATGYIMIRPITIPIHAVGTIPDTHLRPGKPFAVSLATDLFKSSTKVKYERVVRQGGQLLTDIFLESPATVKGIWSRPGPLHLELVASDLFSHTALNFTFIFVNQQIKCNVSEESLSGGSKDPVIKPIVAGVAFTRTVVTKPFCTDPDEDDELLYAAVPDRAHPWVETTMGSRTGVLALSGVAPAILAVNGSVVNISITVRESWTDEIRDVDIFQHYTLQLPILQNFPPVIKEDLPNITMIAGEVKRVEVSIAEYFDDNPEDQLRAIFLIEKNDLVSWLDVDINTKPPSYTLLASPATSVPDGTEIELDMYVEDQLGARTRNLTITVSVEWTLWMKAMEVVVVLGSIGSTILTGLGFWWLGPTFINCVWKRYSRKVVIPCPLSADHPEHTIPLNTIRCQYLVKDPNKTLGAIACLLPAWTEDQLTLVACFDGEVPPWLELKEFKLRLRPPSRNFQSTMPVITFRCFSRQKFLLQQFTVDYKEATKGWDFEKYPADSSSISSPIFSNGGAAGASSLGGGRSVMSSPLLSEPLLREDCTRSAHRLRRERNVAMRSVNQEMEQREKRQNAEIAHNENQLRTLEDLLSSLQHDKYVGKNKKQAQQEEEDFFALPDDHFAVEEDPREMQELDDMLHKFGVESQSEAVGKASRANAAQAADLQEALSGVRPGSRVVGAGRSASTSSRSKSTGSSSSKLMML